MKNLFKIMKHIVEVEITSTFCFETDTKANNHDRDSTIWGR